MGHEIWTLGKLSACPLTELADTYAARIRRHTPIAIHRLKGGKDPTTEGEMLTKRLKSGMYVVGLDTQGTAWSSDTLATALDDWRSQAQHQIFIVGGSHGFDASFRRRCNALWSLGPLTLPHRLALLICAEQLYRAHTILRNEPYHHR